MQDRLVWLLQHFNLRADVFQAGPLCHSASYHAQDGLGYIHFLRSGKLRLSTPGKKPVKLDQPSMLFYLAPATHHFRPIDKEVDLVCATFQFGSGIRNPLSTALDEAVILPLQQMPSLHTTLDLLFREATEQHCGRQVVLDRLIEVVIIEVLRDLMDQNRLNSGLLAALAEKRLAKAINAIHKEPARQWTLQGLAAVAGMSRARFATRFHEIVGTTPGSYLTEWRIAIAQSLLSKGKAVQLVADEVGYGSASALSRAFTAQLGITPSSWKKQALRKPVNQGRNE
ncbi:MAG: AraC family transcriptional regulator [Gammaproteobacteria bacterium]|nr:AraC family transcriptional regulator [Gammaproteobacteria bacterium]